MRGYTTGIVLGMIILSAGTAPGADLPTWQLAQLNDQDLSNWGPAAEQDGRACRAAQAER